MPPRRRRSRSELPTAPVAEPSPRPPPSGAAGGRRKSVVFTPAAEDGAGPAEPEEWSYEHAQLLYMVSLYAQPALAASDKEGWIRQIPLFVLMFEGIVAGVLPYDYAPCSMLITSEGRSKRLWMNVTQEGKAAIDDLREKKLINGLKLSAKDFSPVTAYQTSLKGIAFLAVMPQHLKDQVDAFLAPPGASADRGRGRGPPPPIISVSFDGDGFWLAEAASGFRRRSLVTETEDVSYVSSPYLPACLRRGDGAVLPPFSSNAHRSHESAVGTTTIAEDVSEAIVLGGVHAMIGEWIPWGSNQIVALNERLGALDRCQGGLFTAMVDTSPNDTRFVVPPGLTQVAILDHEFTRYINFEAEVYYPEAPGIVQIESLGMHLQVDGTIVYGLFVEAIMDRDSSDVSLDLLSRLLVDIHKDSSLILNDLLSSYQRSLLDVLYNNDTQRRNKYNLLLASEIKPKLPADEYMDKGVLENELKQVLGDLRAVFDVSADDVLVVGRAGLLAAGPNVRDYEQIICVYLSLLARDLFVRNYFVRLFVASNTLGRIRELIMDYNKDPNRVEAIRVLLNEVSRDIVLMRELLTFLLESVDHIAIPAEPAEDGPHRRLFKMLDVGAMKTDVELRCNDLNKLIDGAHNQLATLQQMADVLNQRQLGAVFANVQGNTKALVDASAANERSSASLEVMQVILAGSFAFDIVDRVSGGTLNVTVPDWVDELIITPIVGPPMLFWAVNMLWLASVSVALTKLMAWLAARARGAVSVRVKLNRRIRVPELEARVLAGKAVKSAESIIEAGITVRKVAWQEPDDEDSARRWGGCAPEIEAVYDAAHGFLLSVAISVDGKRTAFREPELLEAFDRMLEGVYVVEPSQKERRTMSVSGVKFL